MDGALAPATIAHARPKSVLGQFNTVFAAALGIPDVAHRSALDDLLRRPLLPAGAVCAGFAAVEQDWRRCRAITSGGTSVENWRWREPKLGISAANTSAEVRLERALIASLGREDPENWANQVPVASGVAGGSRERRRAIDLVHRLDDGRFELIELKVASDTPLYAACEILGYACVWLLARQCPRPKPNALLAARRIDAVVLAPAAFYSRHDLTSLEAQLDAEVAALGREHDLSLSFRFESFPDELAQPPFTDERMLRLANDRQRLGT